MDEQTPEAAAFERALAAGTDHRPADAERHWQPAYVVTADVDAVRDRALAAGIAAPEVEERDYGSRELAVRDPEGNQWSFGTYAGEPRRTAGG